MHFVYVYKDLKGRIEYVGYGKNAERARSHQSNTHNELLESVIESGKYSLHIAGPFNDENTARAIEAALISCVEPKCNKKQEKSEWRFRPIGITEDYSDRLVEPALTRKDIISACDGRVMFVRISDKELSNRKGYNLNDLPNDNEIVDRVEKYWQVNKFIETWTEKPEKSPKVLIGINGAPGAQVIIGALEIDQSGWKDAEVKSGGLVTIPLLNKNELDAFSLRGRKVEKAVELKFGAIKPHFFKILKMNCQYVKAKK